jgi:superfamily I DNA/RNA helicase
MADDARGADAAARRLAQTDFTRPLVLEAGAGTGKTTTLVARVLAWCLGPGWVRHHRRLEDERRRLGKRQAASDDDVAAAALGRVVAITFTEAAAARTTPTWRSPSPATARGSSSKRWSPWRRPASPPTGSTRTR